MYEPTLIYRNLPYETVLAIKGYCKHNDLPCKESHFETADNVGLTEEGWKQVKKAMPTLFHEK